MRGLIVPVDIDVLPGELGDAVTLGEDASGCTDAGGVSG
jgi:hypothetical protein